MGKSQRSVIQLPSLNQSTFNVQARRGPQQQIHDIDLLGRGGEG